MMTHYPAEYAPHWSEYPLPVAIRIFRDALHIMDKSPRRWALYHNVCLDLPSAWWAACHAYELENDPEWVTSCGGSNNQSDRIGVD